MSRTLHFAVGLALVGCSSSVEEPTDIVGLDEAPEIAPGEMQEGASIAPLALDLCDEPSRAGSSWQQVSSAHFNLNHMPNTLAESERQAILQRLERAYDVAHYAFEMTGEPRFTINVSPSHNAAVANFRGLNRAFAYLDRYDLVHTGMADSFDAKRYGEIVTTLLDFHIDSMNRYRIPVLATGLAAYLDMSGRDLHGEYAKQLIAGNESRLHSGSFDSKDVAGKNPGRAGSLVKLIIERYGMSTFMDIYRATAVNWTGNCHSSFEYDCISTPADLTRMMDGVLRQYTAESWSELQAEWLVTVDAAIAETPYRLGNEAVAEIVQLFRVQDHAIARDNAAMYRSTLDGFYCSNGGDPLRDEIAARAVVAYRTLRTDVIEVYDTGMKTFPSAQALVVRTDEHGVSSFATVSLERLPVGWRVTGGPDWQ